ncbi:hypothetical protein XBKQ1_2640010 [Xenorhabdus bovienii str. kraussei Quebec]|uniref:Uncharacterized protein n=1 Tax=Xenorhabdus bovienii str. kraussei Quebec TaxID=1398203 RepID=A0A077P7N9_XENBV|nr:hypothetical protein XBKQ1_2640010 [Xenorhabdus bovienii str. kraussei Quebec]
MLDYGKVNGEGWQFIYRVLQRDLNKRLSE